MTITYILKYIWISVWLRNFAASQNQNQMVTQWPKKLLLTSMSCFKSSRASFICSRVPSPMSRLETRHSVCSHAHTQHTRAAAARNAPCCRRALSTWWSPSTCRSVSPASSRPPPPGLPGLRRQPHLDPGSAGGGRPEHSPSYTGRR